MMKCVPSTLALPNYIVNVRKDVEDQMYFGTYNNSTLELCVAESCPAEQEFDKYVFCVFTVAAIGAAIEMKLGDYKLHTLGGFLFHLFNNNKMKKLLNDVEKGKRKKGEVLVPDFKLSWQIGDPEEEDCCALNSAGYLIPVYQKIVVATDTVAQFRPVVMVHEIIEWYCFYYGMRLPHPLIQTLAEYITFVIRNNNFLD